MINHIVCVDTNYNIGADNEMLWHIPEELAYFKRITLGHPVIMGRNTYESIGSKPLPGRDNFVVSSKGLSLESAIEQALAKDDEIFIIGGASIYEQTRDLIDTLYITVLDRDYSNGKACVTYTPPEGMKLVSVTRIKKGVVGCVYKKETT